MIYEFSSEAGQKQGLEVCKRQLKVRRDLT